MRAFSLILLLCLGGCEVLQSEAERGVSYSYYNSPPMTFTTADVRVITDRPSATNGHRIVCTEPAPDVAKAVSGNFLFGASGGNGVANGKLDVSGASAEAVAELAGRSTALMGLRDGLYRACEGYANGAIGQDVYALIISRYSQLMSTLFLGQDMTGAFGRSGTGIPSPTLLQSQAIPDATPPQAAPKLSSQWSGARLPLIDAAVSDAPAILLQPIGATVPTQTPGLQTTLQNGQVAANEVVARALTRMNEDFINLSATHAIVVACINNADPTRDRRLYSDGSSGLRVITNTLLDQECPSLLRTILQLEANAAGHSAAPVNPDPSSH